MTNDYTMKEQLQIICSHYNITKTKLAETIGVTKGAISQIMSDSNTTGRKLKDENVDNLLKAYPEINRTWLVTGIGEMFNSPDTLQTSLFGTTGMSSTVSTTTATLPISEEAKPVYSKTERSATSTSAGTHSTSLHSTDVNPIREKEMEHISGAIAESLMQKPVTPKSESVAAKPRMAKIERIVIFYSDGTFSEHTPKDK